MLKSRLNLPDGQTALKAGCRTSIWISVRRPGLGRLLRRKDIRKLPALSRMRIWTFHSRQKRLVPSLRNSLTRHWNTSMLFHRWVLRLIAVRQIRAAMVTAPACAPAPVIPSAAVAKIRHPVRPAEPAAAPMAALAARAVRLLGLTEPLAKPAEAPAAPPQELAGLKPVPQAVLPGRAAEHQHQQAGLRVDR